MMICWPRPKVVSHPCLPGPVDKNMHHCIEIGGRTTTHGGDDVGAEGLVCHMIGVQCKVRNILTFSDLLSAFSNEVLEDHILNR